MINSHAAVREICPASCSNGALYEGCRSSKFSSCSFLPSNTLYGSRTFYRFASNVSIQNPVRSQALAPLTNQGKNSRSNTRGRDQPLPSPDSWIGACVCDIVKNIDEGPSLHMLYNLRDGGPVIASRSHIVSDRHLVSVDEKWREVRDHIKDASPDGVILVQKLDDEVKDSNGRNSENSLNGSQNTNLWGLLVLGRDITNIACYILKTTCVSSSIGTCTQYCLTKAKCFGASCYDQIQNCWL